MNSKAGSTGNTAINKAIELHQSGQLQKADKAYSRILAKKPSHIDALHMRGVLKLEQGNHEFAENLLKQALQVTNDDPWIRYHFAQVLAATSQHKAAIVQFRKSIGLGATEADVYYSFANSLFELNLLPEAIENYLFALERQPYDRDCRLNLANAYEAAGEVSRAVEYLEPLAVEENADIHIKLQLAELLLNSGRARQAHTVLLTIGDQISADDIDHVLSTARTMQKKVRHDSSMYLLGLVRSHMEAFSQSQLDLTIGLLNDLGLYGESQEILDNLGNAQDRSAWSWFQHGLCAQVAGNFQRAAEYHQKALQLDDTLGAAAYSLATNGSVTVEGSLLNGWESKKGDTSVKSDRQAQFAFAAARVRDHQKEYDQAFASYLQGNKLTATDLPFDAVRWDSYTDSLIETFSADFFKQWQQYSESITHSPDAGQHLCFIVGMPRSGSTMLEQTLKNRAGITGLGEHHAMRRIVADIPELTDFKHSAPQCAIDLQQFHIDDFRQLYLASLSQTSLGQTSLGNSRALTEMHVNGVNSVEGRFVDKMLGNFVRLGVIALMFPKARILHSARNPMATGVSCFTNAFNSGLRFTYDLNAMGRAWQSYNRLMQHWHEVLPIPIMDVQYEKMVTDTDNYFKSVMEFLDISGTSTPVIKPADEAGNIATASYWQARQEISTKSLSSWERFDKYLDPLREGLKYQRHD